MTYGVYIQMSRLKEEGKCRRFLEQRIRRYSSVMEKRQKVEVYLLLQSRAGAEAHHVQAHPTSTQTFDSPHPIGGWCTWYSVFLLLLPESMRFSRLKRASCSFYNQKLAPKQLGSLLSTYASSEIKATKMIPKL